MTTDALWEDMPTDWSDPEEAGMLPLIIRSEWDLPAADQISEGYAHGGGMKPQPGFTLIEGGLHKAKLAYPGDPDLRERSRIYLPYSCELVILFEHDFVAIVNDEGELVVTRMD